MTHPFEVRDEITVDATPDEVWEAIASGPGVDSWLMGRTEIDSASRPARSTCSARCPPPAAEATGESPRPRVLQWSSRLSSDARSKTFIEPGGQRYFEHSKPLLSLSPPRRRPGLRRPCESHTTSVGQPM
jgi:hypothetical protein